MAPILIAAIAVASQAVGVLNIVGTALSATDKTIEASIGLQKITHTIFHPVIKSKKGK